MEISNNAVFPEARNPDTIYEFPYEIVDGCLCQVKLTREGGVSTRLCNFAPRIMTEITIDDGTELKRKYVIGGTDQKGRPLQEVEVDATGIEKMDWMNNNWDASLDLDIVPQVERHVRRAIKSTAKFASKKCIYTHTGWKNIEGSWVYLMPGCDRYEVQLQGKQKNYGMEQVINAGNYTMLRNLLLYDSIPHETVYPCLALVFLTPLNEFLKQIGHEPKFLLTLLGRTGSMKSTLAALMVSFFGRFSATDLPMSFRDTANSIIYSSFALKDVLTCVDDYHPTGRKDAENMKEIMQTVARGYGDRTARNRLTADITLRETRPPQGNVIITAEFAPDIGESGTARLFCIEMRPGEMNLDELTNLQEQAARGELTHLMYAYTEWIKAEHLGSEEQLNEWLHDLEQDYRARRELWREKLTEQKIPFHNRIPDTLTCLEIGFEHLLSCLECAGVLSGEEVSEARKRYEQIMLVHAARQSVAVEQDKPTHTFVTKLSALLDCGQICVISVGDKSGILPPGCMGYEDSQYYYLFFEPTQKAVRGLCKAQGQDFPITPKALCKALSDEGFLNTDIGSNTRSMRFGNKTRRVILLRKDKMEEVLGGIENRVTRVTGVTSGTEEQ